MTGWMAWTYHDADGTPVFQHYRVGTNAGRGKRYGYRYPATFRDGRVSEWVWQKHPLADTLIYRLPVVLANPREPLWLCEGERDADEFLDRGVLASCHHGGAGKFTSDQAARLLQHRGLITLVVDRDEAGAYDVCRRFDLLRAIGIPADRLRAVVGLPGHRGADARDHFEAGYGIADFEAVPLDLLREVAASITPAMFDADGYCTPEEVEQLRRWKPKIVPAATPHNHRRHEEAAVTSGGSSSDPATS